MLKVETTSGVPIETLGIADAELGGRGALGVEHAGAVGVDRLQNLMTRISKADLTAYQQFNVHGRARTSSCA